MEPEFDIAVRGLCKRFPGTDRPALDNVDLSIRRGEFFTLLGPSGCGKSTLLRIIAGFERADAGSVHLAGRDMRNVPAHRRDLNLVFQHYALFPHLSAGDNVAFGVSPPDPDRVRECLALVNLSGYENRRISTLSGGEQQRLALARAIAPRPRVLLLDEPLGALDLKLRRNLQEELRRLQHSLGTTFVHVTHDQDEALALSDMIAVFSQGQVQQIGSPTEIYERPATRFVAEFVGTANFLDVGMIRPESIRLVEQGVPAVVEDVLYLGATTQVFLRAGDRRLIAEGPYQVHRGERVQIAWRAEDVRTFQP